MKHCGIPGGVLPGTYKRLRIISSMMKRKVHTPRLPVNKDNKVYIHLGCGEINAPGFINIDAIPFPHVHHVRNGDDLSIFPGKYADLIYVSHVLEHFGHNELTGVLSEWYRVLKEWGILRLSVPDFDKIINIYVAEGNDIQSIMSRLMGGQTSVYNFHKSVFNDKYLRQLLLSVGFTEVREWHTEKVELHSFDDWASRAIDINGRKYPISLNLEAIR